MGAPNRRVNRLRQLCGLTWKELAEVSGLSRHLLLSISLGRRALTGEALMQLGFATGASPESLRDAALEGAPIRDVFGRDYADGFYRLWQERIAPALFRTLWEQPEGFLKEWWWKCFGDAVKRALHLGSGSRSLSILVMLENEFLSLVQRFGLHERMVEDEGEPPLCQFRVSPLAALLRCEELGERLGVEGVGYDGFKAGDSWKLEKWRADRERFYQVTMDPREAQSKGGGDVAPPVPKPRSGGRVRGGGAPRGEARHADGRPPRKRKGG